jgi:hypothetical protein
MSLWLNEQNYLEIFRNQVVCGYMCNKGSNKGKVCCRKLFLPEYNNFHPFNRRCVNCRDKIGVDLFKKKYPNIDTESHLNFPPPKTYKRPDLSFTNNSNSLRINPISRPQNTILPNRLIFRNNNTIDIFTFNFDNRSDDDEEDNLNLAINLSLLSLEKEEKSSKTPPKIINDNKNTQNDNNKINDCVICLTEPPNYAIIPCGHVCFCDNCIEIKAHEKLQNKCPICRIEITSILKLYK